MDNIKIWLPKQNKKISIPIDYKDIKSIRLKVDRDGKVKISAPFSVNLKTIYDFVLSKAKWLDNKVYEISSYQRQNNITSISDNSLIRILGSDYIVILRTAQKNHINIEDNYIIIYSGNISDQALIKKHLEIFLRKALLQIVNEYIKKWCNLIKDKRIVVNRVNIRRMKTLWGSCNRKKQKITINYYLYQTIPHNIEYIVLHELLHFIVQNHSKDFYNLLNKYMPDWKERKKGLSYIRYNTNI